MDIANIILLIMIALFFLFCLYENHLSDYFNGQTYARVELKREGRLDGAIFIVLVVILLYKNAALRGTVFTSYLLGSLILISCYCFFWRRPKFIIKEKGFIYFGTMIQYDRIQGMRLTEEGVLLIALEKKVLSIHVANLDDLELFAKELKPRYLAYINQTNATVDNGLS